MNRRVFVTLVVLLLPALPCSAVDDGLQARLQETLDAFLIANPQVPGVVVHFICPTRDFEWTAVSGLAENGNSGNVLMPTHTFRIASNTKTYVAAAILRLVEMEKLDLDDPLALRLPHRYREALSTDGYDLDAMTIAQVLSHTSGLFEHPADPRYAEAILADPQRQWTRDEQVRLCVEWGDPVGKPGEKFQYSDTGYVLLGAVIEELTGKSLGRATHDLLDYEALGLGATWWEIDEQKPETAGPRAHQYYFADDTTDWNCSLDLYGGGGLLTDAADLAWFMRKVFLGDVFQQPGTLTAMTERGTLPYRLGLMRVEMAGRLAWGHTGFWNTFAFHVPDLDLTIAGAVLNHDGERGQVLAEALVADWLEID